jgi:hypothetical protein
MASSIPGRPSGVRVSDLAILPWHLGALLPAVALDRMTVERLTLALMVVAAVVQRSAAKSPGTYGWSWEDLVAAPNGRVFFWPGNQDRPNRYGHSFIDGYRRRGQTR